MTENLSLSDLALRPPYEQVRAGVDDSAKSAWDSVDRAKSNLRATYQRLKEQDHFTEEHRAKQAWQAYETTKQQVEKGNEKLREQLKSAVRSGERFSLPMPKGESVTVSDTNKLLASQHEAARIVRKVERQQDSAGKKSPFKRDSADVLREEYGRGLEMGGMQGGVVCRAVLSAADELGIDTDSVVDSFRGKRHRESLARAQRNALALDAVGGGVPEPPFKHPQQRGRGSEPPKRQTTFLVDKSGPILKSSSASSGSRARIRRRPWK